jgi:hypothetical protein
MTDRINPAMNTVQPTFGDLAGNRARAEPSVNELCLRDNTVLPGRNPCNLRICCVAFFPHTGNKETRIAILPR